MTLAPYLNWSMEILVTVTQSTKWSKNKKIVGYIFTCCISLASSLSLLAGFVVQSLIAVLLCQLVCTLVEVLGNMTVLGTSSGPYKNIWVGKAEGTTHASWSSYHPTFQRSMHVQSDNICLLAAWLPEISTFPPEGLPQLSDL